jgi:integrase
MATVTFVLKNPKTKKEKKDTNDNKEKKTIKETLIFLVMYIDQKRIVLSTGKKINPKNWNPDNHMARQTGKYNNYRETNERLVDLKEKAFACYDKHMVKNSRPYIDKLRKELELVIRPKPQKEPDTVTFFKAIDQYISAVNRKPWTIKHYKTTLAVLKEYQTSIGEELDFDDLTIEFYESFIRFCNEATIISKDKDGKLVTSKRFAYNTVGTHIKNIKVFHNYALEKGYTEKTLPKKFRVFAETADTIYLNEQELKSIYDLDLSDNSRLEHQRDLFMIGCYTGLRFGDLTKLKKENIIRGGTRIRVKTEKTGETVEIPLHWTIMAILNKYDSGLPNVISDQKMNDYLKEIAEKAKLNEIIIKAQTRGGSKTETRHNKWELVTVHTARRSFATNAFLAGVPSISIMKITGHRSEKSFLKYIKITQEQNADLMANHPFFSKPPLEVVHE